MIRKRCAMVVYGMLLSVVGWVAPASAVVNGDFDAALNGWTTAGPVSDGGGFALLEEDPVFAITSLEQQIVLPMNALALTFEYGFSSTPDGTSGFPMADGFSASLLDPATFNPLLSTPGYTDYFYEDRTGIQDFDSSIVTVVGNRVTLDLTGIAAGTNALIALDLLGGDDGYATKVMVDNVEITTGGAIIPAPGAVLLVSIGAALTGRFRRRA